MAALKSDRGLGASRLFDITSYLGDELCFICKSALITKPAPELDDEPPSVEVALEIEQEYLNTPFVPAVMGIRSDRDRGAMAGRPTHINPERGR